MRLYMRLAALSMTRHLFQFLQAGREAEAALAGAWSMLEGTLSDQRAQLEAFTAEQAAGMQTWREQLAQGLIGARRSLQGASNAVQDVQAHAASAASQQHAALHSLERDFRAQLLSDQVPCNTGPDGANHYEIWKYYQRICKARA